VHPYFADLTDTVKLTLLGSHNVRGIHNLCARHAILAWEADR